LSEAIVFNDGASSDQVLMRGNRLPSQESDSGSPRWATQPKLAFGRFNTGGGRFTHVAMENIHFYSPSDDFRGSYAAEADGDPVQYWTFRHLTCSGSGTDMGGGTESSASRRCFNFMGAPTNPLRFVVIYDTDMFGLGHWVDDFGTDVDLIGMHVQGATYYLWFLNNRFQDAGNAFAYKATQ
jgi:hypothetical protein